MRYHPVDVAPYPPLGHLWTRMGIYAGLRRRGRAAICDGTGTGCGIGIGIRFGPEGRRQRGNH